MTSPLLWTSLSRWNRRTLRFKISDFGEVFKYFLIRLISITRLKILCDFWLRSVQRFCENISDTNWIKRSCKQRTHSIGMRIYDCLIKDGFSDQWSCWALETKFISGILSLNRVVTVNSLVCQIWFCLWKDIKIACWGVTLSTALFWCWKSSNAARWGVTVSTALLSLLNKACWGEACPRRFFQGSMLRFRPRCRPVFKICDKTFPRSAPISYF